MQFHGAKAVFEVMPYVVPVALSFPRPEQAINNDEQKVTGSERRFQNAVLVQGPVGGIAEQVEDEFDDLAPGENRTAFFDAGGGETLQSVLNRARTGERCLAKEGSHRFSHVDVFRSTRSFRRVQGNFNQGKLTPRGFRLSATGQAGGNDEQLEPGSRIAPW